MSLLTDCHRWSARAILALDDATRGGLEETHLQAALGVSMMFTRGGSDAAGVALNRGFAIAEQRGDALDQLQVLGPLQMFHIRTGDFNTALGFARRCSTIASTLEDSGALALAHALLGISLHLGGDLQCAGMELAAALRHGPNAKRSTTIYLGFESQILAGAILARNLWLQGHPAQAVEQARQTVNAAAPHGPSLDACDRADLGDFRFPLDRRCADRQRAYGLAYFPRGILFLGPYLAVGHGFEGELAIRRGDASGGIKRLQDCLKELHAAPYELLTTPLTLSLVQGLAGSGHYLEGLALIDEVIGLVKANGDVVHAGVAACEGQHSWLDAAGQPRRGGDELHGVT